MFDAVAIPAIAGTFLIAGTVKGVIGLGLPRDALTQAMGMLLTVPTPALAVSLQANDLLRTEHGALSTMALAPAAAGMAAGRLPRLARVRRLKPYSKFREGRLGSGPALPHPTGAEGRICAHLLVAAKFRVGYGVASERTRTEKTNFRKIR